MRCQILKGVRIQTQILKSLVVDGQAAQDGIDQNRPLCVGPIDHGPGRSRVVLFRAVPMLAQRAWPILPTIGGSTKP